MSFLTSLFVIFFLLVFLLIFIIKISNISYDKLYSIGYRVKIFLKKRDQKYFFLHEKYKFKIRCNNKFYYSLNNYYFSDSAKNDQTASINKKLNGKYIQTIIILFSKSTKYFDYFLDKKTFSRKLFNNSFNFLKINLKKIKHFNFVGNNDEMIIKTFFIKKAQKKKLTLLLLLDGMGSDITGLLNNSNKYFGKNNLLKNAWSNAEWTLPSFGNLLSGKYTSNHLCFENLSYYSSYCNLPSPKKQIQIKTEKNIFEYFKKLDFVTGCYSPYHRINPTYGHDKGVDIFKFCDENSADEIVDNVISQIEMFDKNSNFIFAHFFDTHGAFNLKHHHRIAEYSSFPENNYSFDKNREDLNKFAVSVKDEYQTIELASAFSNADKKLLNLYNYLNKKKFDDFTIILFGDHGTRFKKHLKTGNLLSKSHNNIGLYIKDKKYNFKSKKNNFVEIIDFLPSLLYRYSKNKFFQDLKKIDGKNTLYSNYKKKRIIVESVYPPKYQLQIKTKNLYSYSTYDFKNYQIGDQKNIKYYNNKEKFLNEKSLNKTGISEISAIKNKHLNKIALDKIN